MLVIKILLAIIVGYLVDWLVTYKAKEPVIETVNQKLKAAAITI